MRYTAKLDGRQIGKGGLQDIQTAVMEAVTGLLAQDPQGAAEGAQGANQDFQDGAVEHAVKTWGQWRREVGGRRLEVTRRKGWLW